MQDSKYRDKKYLIKYDLDTTLFEKFDLKVTDLIPIRNVFFISTNKGDKVLKKIEYCIDDLYFIDSAIEYIKPKFNKIMEFVKTKEGKIFVFWRDDVYCIMDMVDGMECQFNSIVDLQIISRGLGEFHSASEGFRYNRYNKNSCGKLIDNFKRKLEELYFFKKIAELHEHKSEFDDIFLTNIGSNIEITKESISLLEKSSYYKLCSEEDKIALCHHDLANHNILIKEGEAYFIDFDYAIIDLKVHDLCNLINKVEKEFDFEIEKSEIILREYLKTNRLDNKELETLFGMLIFPEDFYSISKDYYTRRKEWDEDVFVDRLNRKANYMENRQEFLENFKCIKL